MYWGSSQGVSWCLSLLLALARELRLHASCTVSRYLAVHNTATRVGRRYPASVTTNPTLGTPLFRALSKSWGILQTQVLHGLQRNLAEWSSCHRLSQGRHAVSCTVRALPGHDCLDRRSVLTLTLPPGLLTLTVLTQTQRRRGTVTIA